LYACNKDEVAEKWAKEEKDLELWMKDNHPDAIFDNGIYIEKTYSIYSDSIQPETGDNVLVNFACKFIFEDNLVEQVSYKNWEAHGALSPSLYREGGPELWLSEYWSCMGIGHLYERERANIYIPSRLLVLPDFRTRKFEIELVKVIEPDLKSYQQDIMGKCMKKYGKNIDTITIKDNGKDYYVIYHIEKGKGDDVDVSSVKTRYTETYYLQDGDPRSCISDAVKVGWDKKFTKMFESVKKGGRITAMMPYRLMYGDEPYTDNNTKQFIAPLGSVLRYEINIDP